jgi:hypothetical protein
VDEGTLGGNDQDRREVQEVLALFEAPAYIRRARGVEAALEGVLLECRSRREEWLSIVRTRLGMLRALAGDWPALRRWLDEEQLGLLRDLHDQLTPKLRVPLASTTSRRVLRRALDAALGSLGRFNRRWRKHIAELDLSTINDLREGYNRYYLVEKECAIRSPALARRGYQPLAPLTTDEVLALLPPLPEPRMMA